MRELFFAVAVTLAAAEPPDDGLHVRAIHVRQDGKLIARIWASCKRLAFGGTREEHANFSAIRRDELLGVVEFMTGWRDFRGQRVSPGVYAMRYAVQPLLKDHAGTSQWRDFAVLTGPPRSGHPFIMSLVPEGEGDAILDVAGTRIGLELDTIGQTGF